ncbi:sulfotransferase family protein [Pimelobacter simplex]|uniref:sulfotransferase family protein n=1 Tax=Nocardioides simplex TaxID=2045 RepID=UPI00193373F0|nr:sulfotransferase [Pimelobacter simplex]
MSQQPARIDDLSSPRFAPEVAEVHGLMGSMAADLPLTSESLHAAATAQTGLDDFGPQDYRERLDVLLGALNDIPGATNWGRVIVHTQLVQLLKNRALLQRLLRDHPEIHEVELAPPVIIAGLPRTGTTHLHNLLAASGLYRTLPYWESLEPFPLPSESGTSPDPRRERCDQGIDFLHQNLPLFPLMHEMTTDHVHEEIQLLANDFSSMLFETLADVPAWRDYYLEHDQEPHYRHLRLQLQALQFLDGGKRWLLKSPQHLEQLPTLARVFPDATVALTHRDPARVAVSMATMVAYSRRMTTDPVDAVGTGRYWSDRLDAMLTTLVHDRDRVRDLTCTDVRFDDFIADELGTAASVIQLAGGVVTDVACDNMAGYLETHVRGRLGTIDYRAEDLGLDIDELRTRFEPYSARFLV